MKKTKVNSKKEDSWIEIAEKSLYDIWDNEKDKKHCSSYGSQPKLEKFKESGRVK